jgi:GTPase SAR1 family protein
MPASIARPARLRADLDALAEAVADLRFDYPDERHEVHRRVRDQMLASIATHLDPRLQSLEAPLLVAIFGPTGSGKSTITNTIAGRQVSRSGVLRPTTREAVVWCHRSQSERVRSSALASSGPIEVVEDDHPLLHSLTIVDTPDIDSVATDHRRQTEKILLMADAAIAVTTPQRYADAVPWEFLADLTDRGMPLHVVMNRASRRSSGAVTDLVGLLRSAGVGEVRSVEDVLTINEQRVRSDGRLHGTAVKRLVTELEDLAARQDEVIRQGIDGAVQRVVHQADTLAKGVSDQREQLRRRWETVSASYESQAAEVERQLGAGDLVKGEVVERWRRLVGVGDLARVVTKGVGRLRDLVLPASVDDGVEAVEREVRAELVGMALHRMGRASSLVGAGWDADPAGAALLEQVRPIDRSRTEEMARLEIDAWMADVVEMVRSQGKTRFRLARAISLGVNATATVLLVGVFASTGGLSGGEVGVVAGTAAAQQTILEHVLGSAAAGRLAVAARKELVDRIGRLLWTDADRFRDALQVMAEQADVETRLTERATNVELAAEELLR